MAASGRTHQSGAAACWLLRRRRHRAPVPLHNGLPLIGHDTILSHLWRRSRSYDIVDVVWASKSQQLEVSENHSLKPLKQFKNFTLTIWRYDAIWESNPWRETRDFPAILPSTSSSGPAMELVWHTCPKVLPGNSPWIRS